MYFMYYDYRFYNGNQLYIIQQCVYIYSYYIILYTLHRPDLNNTYREAQNFKALL